MPRRTALKLRWRNVALAAALLATGAGVAMWVLRQPDTASVVPAAGLPDRRIDLRDILARSTLSLVADRQFGDYPPIASGLFRRCDTTTADTIAASIVYAYGPILAVEIRRGTGTEASALVWSEPRWPAPRVPAEKRGVAGFPQPRPVAEREFAAIVAEFIALSSEGTAPVDWAGSFDSSIVLLEICRGGEYGLFVRDRESDLPSQRVFALARRVAAAGVPEPYPP